MSAGLHYLGINLVTDQALQVLALSGLFATVAAAVATYVLVRQDSAAIHVQRAALWRYSILGILPIAVLAIGVGVYSLVPNTPYAGIAILVSAALIGLLLALAVVAVFFYGLSINDKNEALGLPRGSVRAVIALALILVFAIMSVYVYGSSDGQAAEDIAKQLITTLSVLVVAVSSFYFGSKSVEAATTAMGNLAGGASVSVSPSKATITGGPEGPWSPSIVVFTVHAYPPSAKIATTVWGDEAGSVSIGQGTGEWVYTPKHPTKSVGIQFFQSNDPTVNSTANVDVRDPARAAERPA